MDFSFSIHAFLKDEITIIDRNNEHLKYSRSPLKDGSHRDELREVINKLGTCSAKAQGLNGSVTSLEQLNSSEQRCYIMKDITASSANGVVLGLLKVGPKKLFFVSPDSQQVEVTPLCVLDFYVHESCQRQGHGLKLFTFMMQKEGITPGALAIDRPSEKMLSFYKKRFQLAAPMKQPNNFVVFREFFTVYTPSSSKRWTDHERRGPITLKANTLHNKATPPKFTNPPPKSTKVPTGSVTPNIVELPSLLSRPLSRLVSAPAAPAGATRTSPPQPNRIPSREKTFSWSRNNVNVSYIVGRSNAAIMTQSRYTNYDRPRPF